MSALTAPYAELTPEVVMNALSGLGLWPDGRLLALGAYENRVYRAHLDEPLQGHHAVVLKFYRPGRWSVAQIAEEHRFAADLQAAEVPVVAPLVVQGQTLHTHAGFVFSVSPVRGGRHPELDDPEVLLRLGRYLGRLHLVGDRDAFVHRPPLNLATHWDEPLQWLDQAHTVSPGAQAAWRDITARLRPLLTERLAPLAPHALRLHGDAHPGNILWAPGDPPEGGPHLVDLDDARMGPAVQDLWLLLDGDRHRQTEQLSALLEGYESLRAFDRRELQALEALRTLRMVHYAAWLARRWGDPTFPQHFPWFGTDAYWQEQVQALHAQWEALHEPPLSV